MIKENAPYRIGIEARLTALEVKMEEILTNELPHLSAKVDRLTWLLVTNLTAVIFLLLQKYL